MTLSLLTRAQPIGGLAALLAGVLGLTACTANSAANRTGDVSNSLDSTTTVVVTSTRTKKVR